MSDPSSSSSSDEQQEEYEEQESESERKVKVERREAVDYAHDDAEEEEDVARAIAESLGASYKQPTPQKKRPGTGPSSSAPSTSTSTSRIIEIGDSDDDDAEMERDSDSEPLARKTKKSTKHAAPKKATTAKGGGAGKKGKTMMSTSKRNSKGRIIDITSDDDDDDDDDSDNDSSFSLAKHADSNDDAMSVDSASVYSSSEDEDEDEDEVDSDDLEELMANVNAHDAAKKKKKAAQGKGKKTNAKGSEAEADDDDDDDVKPKTKRETRVGIKITKEQRQQMRDMSRLEKAEFELGVQHPELINCWGDLKTTAKKAKPEPAEQPKLLNRDLLKFQLEGLGWMVKQEQGPWRGGMLADEMGMGKTIQTIALILSDWSDATAATDHHRSTLVLAPTVAIMQWKHEIEKFTTGIKVLVWHGNTRTNKIAEIKKYDVVLTSYAAMESSFRREHKGFQRKGQTYKEDSLVHRIDWHRVILDEAHNIKDRSSNTARAAFALKAQFKWCLSGTPLQNRVGELYSLVRFLGADPFAYYFCRKCDCKSLSWLCVGSRSCIECGHGSMHHLCFWNQEVLKVRNPLSASKKNGGTDTIDPLQPIQTEGPTSKQGKVANIKLSRLLQHMMLRRTKLERADDLGLPPRDVTVRRDYFTEEEEELYKSLYQDVKRKFSSYAEEGTVLNNYSNIFTLITRMRQMADHPDLVLKSKTSEAVQHAPGDKPEELLTCRICFDEAEDAIMSHCRHVFCRECVRQYVESALESRPECPVCHAPMSIDLEQDEIERAVDSGAAPRQGMLSRIDPSKWRTSTKIEALVEELSKLRTEDHTLKSLVFSQFTTFLDLVARRLQLAGFRVVRLQGTMSPAARDNTIKHFMEDPQVTVFLISLKAGGVALNLTEASRVYILDPWCVLPPSLVSFSLPSRLTSRARVGGIPPWSCKRWTASTVWASSARSS